MSRTALRNLTIILAVVAVGLIAAITIILIGRDSDADEPSTFTMTGTLTLATTAGTLDLQDDGSWVCRGDDGYDDIAEGTQVTVYDAAGAVLAAGTLGVGDPQIDNSQSDGGDSPCALPITVHDVPGGHDMYQVEVSHRGKIAFSAADAQAGRVEITLG